MKRNFKTLAVMLAALLLAAVPLQLRAASPPTNTVTVIFDTLALYGLPVTNVQVSITPIQKVLTNRAGAIVLTMPHSMRTGTNGQARTNVWVSDAMDTAYRISMVTLSPPSTTEFTNVFPAGTTGTVYAADFKGAIPALPSSVFVNGVGMGPGITELEIADGTNTTASGSVIGHRATIKVSAAAGSSGGGTTGTILDDDSGDPILDNE